jgi:hypothetical protein
MQDGIDGSGHKERAMAKETRKERPFLQQAPKQICSFNMMLSQQYF